MRVLYIKGMGLVEIVIGTAIIVTGILALSSSYGLYVRYALTNDKNLQSGYIIEEDLEAVTFLRDKSWTTYIQPLSTSTTYYLSWNAVANPYWQTTATPQYVDNTFLRSFVVRDVFRDANGKIASSGTYDPNTKFITASVAYYQGSATTTQTMSTYVANLYAN
jgi:type II secretory pathway pseudopilin PulG